MRAKTLYAGVVALSLMLSPVGGLAEALIATPADLPAVTEAPAPTEAPTAAPTEAPAETAAPVQEAAIVTEAPVAAETTAAPSKLFERGYAMLSGDAKLYGDRRCLKPFAQLREDTPVLAVERNCYADASKDMLRVVYLADGVVCEGWVPVYRLTPLNGEQLDVLLADLKLTAAAWFDENEAYPLTTLALYPLDAPTSTIIIEETPAAEEAPEATEAPAAEEAPEATEAPAAEEAPEATEAPAAEEAPEATEAPAAEEAPEVTEAPATQTDLAVTPDEAREPEAPATQTDLAEPVATETDLAEPLTVTVRIVGETSSFRAGDEVVLAATVAGDYDALNYQWQCAQPNGGEWQDVEGATGAELSFLVNDDNYALLWRVLVTKAD